MLRLQSSHLRSAQPTPLAASSASVVPSEPVRHAADGHGGSACSSCQPGPPVPSADPAASACSDGSRQPSPGPSNRLLLCLERSPRASLRTGPPQPGVPAWDLASLPGSVRGAPLTPLCEAPPPSLASSPPTRRQRPGPGTGLPLPEQVDWADAATWGPEAEGTAPYFYDLITMSPHLDAALCSYGGWKRTFVGSRASHGKSCLTPSELPTACGLLTGPRGEAWQPPVLVPVCPAVPESGRWVRARAGGPPHLLLGPRAVRVSKAPTARGNHSLGTGPTSLGALSFLGGVCSVQLVWQGQP